MSAAVRRGGGGAHPVSLDAIVSRVLIESPDSTRYKYSNKKKLNYFNVQYFIILQDNRALSEIYA